MCGKYLEINIQMYYQKTPSRVLHSNECTDCYIKSTECVERLTKQEFYITLKEL